MLKDVFYESKPGKEEHLKSQYLVFMVNFHGGLDSYLWDMWDKVESDVRRIWGNCVAFEQVNDANGFVEYIKKCQVTNALLFQGSTDRPLDEQLKSLYLKQEFGDFAASHQGMPAAQLKKEFMAFLERVELDNLERPTWKPGATSLDAVLVP